MEISVAQAELRRTYLRSGPGAIVSGIVWLAAGIAAANAGVATGFAILFFGGMLIYPVSTFIARGLLRSGAPSKANQGGLTVIETVFPMVGGLLAAWLLIPLAPDFVFPVAAIAVGAHYFGFRTAYGDWTFWALGGALCLAGIFSIFYGTPVARDLPFLVAAIEIVAGVCLSLISLNRDRSTASPK